jgi:hypothetical protein
MSRSAESDVCESTRHFVITKMGCTEIADQDMIELESLGLMNGAGASRWPTSSRFDTGNDLIQTLKRIIF